MTPWPAGGSSTGLIKFDQISCLWSLVLFCFVFPLPPPDECKSSFFCSRCGLVMLNNKRKKGGEKGHFLFTSRYDTERRVKTKSSSWFLFSFFSPFSKTGHTGDPLHIMTVAYKHTPGISTRCPVCFSCRSSCLRPSVWQEGPTEWFKKRWIWELSIHFAYSKLSVWQ